MLGFMRKCQVMNQRKAARKRRELYKHGSLGALQGEKKREVIGALQKLYGNRCFWCQAQLHDNPDSAWKQTIDHHIPLSRGGPHEMDNLRLVCIRCQGKKGNKMPLEYIAILHKDLL
mgnify:CR=1 FL=1